MDPPAALVLRRTRSALRGRKRTGDDEPRGRPAKGICLSSDVCTLMTIEAVCAEQGRRTLHYPTGHPLGLHSCRVVLLAPPLYAPMTLKLTRVSTFQTLHVLYTCSRSGRSTCSASFACSKWFLCRSPRASTNVARAAHFHHNHFGSLL